MGKACWAAHAAPALELRRAAVRRAPACRPMLRLGIHVKHPATLGQSRKPVARRGERGQPRAMAAAACGPAAPLASWVGHASSIQGLAATGQAGNRTPSTGSSAQPPQLPPSLAAVRLRLGCDAQSVSGSSGYTASAARAAGRRPAAASGTGRQRAAGPSSSPLCTAPLPLSHGTRNVMLGRPGAGGLPGSSGAGARTSCPEIRWQHRRLWRHTADPDKGHH